MPQLDAAYHLLARIENASDWSALTKTDIAEVCRYLGRPPSDDLAAIRADMHRQSLEIARLLDGQSQSEDGSSGQRSAFVRELVELNRRAPR